ncbi:MAG: metallophosphoesterase [Gemmataceae bacterium]
MNRRNFLRTVFYGTSAIPLSVACYGMFESGWVAIERKTVSVPRLPSAFQNTRVAFLTDIHHGPYTDRDFVRQVVRTTNLLDADLILLGGDYTHRDAQYIPACFEELSKLRCRFGVYAVRGNHDYWNGIDQTVELMNAAGIRELNNTGVYLEKGRQRLCLAGVDDLWCGEPDLKAALQGVRPDESAILLSHNPDFAESIRDRRVGLVLSGHTHGGQFVIPGGKAPFTPTKYGDKYLRGLCQAPETQVYVSRGLGTAVMPIRFGSRPEISLLTLV